MTRVRKLIIKKNIFVILLSGFFLSLCMSCSNDDESQIETSQLWGRWKYEGKKSVYANFTKDISKEEKDIVIKYLEASEYEPYIEKAMYTLNEDGSFNIIHSNQSVISGLVYSYSESDCKLEISQSANATEPNVSYEVVTISGNSITLKYTIDLNNIYWGNLENYKENTTSAIALLELTRIYK